jgi:hypothetical protein
LPAASAALREKAAANSLAAVRLQTAFYGSTPAYRPVLELHGWGDPQPELNTLSKEGRCMEMGGLVSDEMIDAFALQAPIDSLAKAVNERFAGILDRVSLNLQWGSDRHQWRAFVAALRAGAPAASKSG